MAWYRIIDGDSNGEREAWINLRGTEKVGVQITVTGVAVRFCGVSGRTLETAFLTQEEYLKLRDTLFDIGLEV